MKSAFKENRVRMGEINSQIEDSLSGIRVVKSLEMRSVRLRNSVKEMSVLWIPSV